MPVVMQMDWVGVTVDQYEQARAQVQWETDVPPGAIYHAASFDDAGAHIVDIWETAEDFQRFSDTRLGPAVAEIGIAGEPQVQIRPAHAIFAPGYTVSLPTQSTQKAQPATTA
ncbi:MAG: hypothetical protein JO222_05275 [Frankiales bacterium]|nr:hypothetical protein [Frankiales bacterium]